MHGSFTFRAVPYGSYQIVVTSSFGVASRAVSLKGDINVAVQYAAPTALRTIAHVSTSSAGAHINVTSASIASVNPSDYAFEGNASWKHLLDEIPGTAVSGLLGGGASFSDSIADSPFQPIVLSINGALPYESSTTLDGMPINNSSYSNTPGSGSNLSFLPMPAFETADVVRGPGANAPSIVDSIGGTFVLHAPGRVESDHFELSTSSDPYGGIVSNTKAALRFGQLSATLIYGVNDSPGPLGSTSVMPALTLTPATIGGQAFHGCTPSGGPCGTEPLDPAYTNGYYKYVDRLLYCCVPYSTAWSQHNGAVGLSYDITPLITAQVFYAGSASAMQLPTFNNLASFTPGTGYSGSVAPGSHILTYVEGPLNIRQASSLMEETLTAHFWDGVLRLAALQNNSFSWESEADALPNGEYTLYGTGYFTSAPSTPVNFNGTRAFVTFHPFSLLERYWNNSRSLLASYATQVGQNASFGISYVTSYYNFPYEFSLPTFHFSTSQSTAVSETTNEFRITGSTDLSDRLHLEGSWYFAHGSYHVPSPTNRNAWADSQFPYSAPRLGVTWEANNNVVIRAAAGGGFALPPIAELVGQNFRFPFGPYYFQLLTNLNLKPEESFAFDIGTDARLQRDTVLSFDVYRTNLFGQIFENTALTGTYLGKPLYTAEYNNLPASRFEGITLNIRHDPPTGVYWRGALGLTRAYVISVPPSFYSNVGCAYCSNLYIVPGINYDGAGVESPVPYTTASAGLGYRWRPGTYVDLAPTYYGKDNPYFEPAFVVLDAHASYAITPNVALLATFSNITGVYDQNYELYRPTLAAPTVSGKPYALFGLLYGPRAVIVTAQFKY